MNVIKTNDALAEACARLRRHEFVAVDTEFMRESTYWPVLCLIQAAAGEDEFIIDPMADGLSLDPFIALMRDENVLKVFHAARQDAEIFHHLAGAPPAPVFDSQVAAAAVGLGDSIAYDNLVAALLNQRVDKSSRFTDWARRPLSEKQLAYALSDVTHLRDLYPQLSARLEQAGRQSWIAEEMRTLTDPATYELHPDDAWKRLKLRKTTTAYLAALKAAAAWREREAQSRNSPRGRILKDDVLYEVALQRPTSADALAGIRAVPKGFERSRAGRDLIEAIAPAISDPPSHAPKLEKRRQPPQGTGPITDLLKVFLRLKAEEIGVASRLIATVADIEELAAFETGRTLTGWRRDAFGEAALALKRGELALKLEGDQVVAVPVSSGAAEQRAS